MAAGALHGISFYSKFHYSGVCRSCKQNAITGVIASGVLQNNWVMKRTKGDRILLSVITDLSSLTNFDKKGMTLASSDNDNSIRLQIEEGADSFLMSQRSQRRNTESDFVSLSPDS